MNRFAKGAFAGAAGIALLLGGAGSFALWNGTATAAAGTIQSGTMTIATTPGAAPSWTVTHGSTTTSIAVIDSFRAVPGDVLTLTQKVDISATGDKLSAVLSIDPTSITSGNTTASRELATALASSVGLTISGALPAGIVAGPTPNTYTVSGALGTKTLTVVASFAFDSATAGTTAQGGTLDLTKLAFALAQQ
jgi:alternate signal-mediated exported protein